ncbi:MAG TPA: 5-formyltetrahydrofolate cyclo-ligase [Nitrososphaeraceae archaeon]|nr:5-formyltetrahydrofolate cyclo-ligase [Nitrososphaeraceae archaeon]
MLDQSSKEEIRKKTLSKRNQLSEKDRVIFSKIIFNKLIESQEYKKADRIAVYYPVGSEVQTLEIIRDALINKKKVGLPRVINDDEIKFYQIIEKYLEEVEFTQGKYGIMENIASTVELDQIDLLIIPGVAFDVECNRIGYGKGYYDRFLGQNYTGYIVGLAFENQIVKYIPINELDQKVDCIITNKNNYYCKIYRKKNKFL